MSTTTTAQVIENLRAEVERNNSIDGSAITLLNALAARVEENINDPVALQALVDEVRNSNDALAAAVTANTPASEG